MLDYRHETNNFIEYYRIQHNRWMDWRGHDWRQLAKYLEHTAEHCRRLLWDLGRLQSWTEFLKILGVLIYSLHSYRNCA